MKPLKLWEIHNEDPDSEWVPANEMPRLKAQWQAEAMERYAEGIARDNDPTDMVCVEDVLTMLLHEAAELRRQPKETTP